MRVRKYIIGVVLIVALTVGIVLTLPWKQWLEARLRQELAARGIEASFTLDAVGLSGVTLKHISLASPLAFTLDELTVGYSAQELTRGELRRIGADKLVLRAGKIKVEAREAALDFLPGDATHRWQGKWQIGSVETTNTPLPLPPLTGKGTFKVSQGDGQIGGEFQSSDRQYQASFTAVLDENPEKSRLTVHRAQIPWNKGMLKAQSAIFPLSGGKEARLTIDAEKLSLGALLESATNQRAHATGTVSGRLPVVIHGDGAFTVKGGHLVANEPGTITLAPDAIPGDNAQLGLLKEVLGNFHYRSLVMEIESDKERNLSLMLRLEGNNPAAYGGKLVKLNVHLTGDVLSFLQQSVMPLTDPKQLLEQETP